MRKIVLPIKLEYAEKIFNGEKRYEFRKFIPRERVSKIYFYCGYPVWGIIGWADVKGIICDSPEQLFRITHFSAGISKEKYDEYFRGRDRAYAYRLGKILRYKKPKSLEYFGLSSIPQGFCYIYNRE